MPDEAAALALLAEEGWATLVDAGLALDEGGGDPLAAAQALARRRPDSGPVARAAALELVTEGAKLARKLGVSDRLLAVRGAVEQATSGRVATWHAQRVPSGARVLEIGCGCGGDSLALAHRAANLIATDLDPVRAACAHVNLTTTGLASARAVPGDGLALLDDEAARADVVFADPDRRAGGTRTLDPERWSPPLSRLAEIASRGRRVLVKAAPSLDPALVAGTFSAAFVSHGGECVEAFLESPDAAPAVRAVLLPDDAPSLELAGDRGDAPAGPVGEAVYTADPAAIRARLLAELCARHALRLVAPGIAFLTGPAGGRSPWLREHAVLEVVASPDAASRGVAAHRAGSVRVHARGTRVPTEELERLVGARIGRACAGPPLDVFVTQEGGSMLAILARRTEGR